MPLLGGPPNIEKLKKQRNVNGLSKALKHQDSYVRLQAAEVLCELGDTRAVRPLIAALQDDVRSVRSRAAAALETFIAFKDTNNALREAAVEALNKFKQQSVDAPVIEEGMTVAMVIHLLGEPKGISNSAAVTARMSGQSGPNLDITALSTPEPAMASFDHPAGSYLIIFQEGVVSEVFEKP